MVRRMGTQKGRGVMDNLRRLHSYVRGKKLISTGLSMAGYKKLGALARQAGYGRRRPAARRAVVRRGVARRRVVATKSGIVLRAPRPRVAALPRSRKMRGRGFIGKTIGGIGGGLLGGLLPF